MLLALLRTTACSLLTLLFSFAGPQTYAQNQTLEQRQPLELVFADSIVPQDRHEAMFTTGAWYFRHGALRHASLTQKVEWGISDKLQVSTFLQLVNRSNEAGAVNSGIGDVEVGARYTWEKVGPESTHVAIAADAGFPTGNPRRGLGEGAYTVSPSLLLSREIHRGKYQLFATTGAELVIKRRRLDPSQEVPRTSVFSNGGLSAHAGHGWVIGELSLSSNSWGGGDETQLALTPAYVWRLRRRTELLVGLPIGLTQSTNRVGAVVKFTFELGGKPE
jgi:hypothetical protein